MHLRCAIVLVGKLSESAQMEDQEVDGRLAVTRNVWRETLRIGDEECLRIESRSNWTLFYCNKSLSDAI
jgi:hypothetical protein